MRLPIILVMLAALVAAVIGRDEALRRNARHLEILDAIAVQSSAIRENTAELRKLREGLAAAFDEAVSSGGKRW